MKILFLAAYSKLAASSRTRVYDYFPFLERSGIKYKYICFIPTILHKLTLSHESFASKFTYYFSSFLLKIINICKALVLAPNYDVVFVQKITLPFGLEKVLKLLNKNIIFDFDDAIFANQKNDFENMLKVSKCCLVENGYNRRIAAKFCPRVEIITGPIDTKNYFVKEKSVNHKIIIGWTGSSSTAKYLYEIKNTFKEIQQKYDVILRFIGVPKDFKIDEVEYEAKEWSLKTEIPMIQDFDIGLMPLPNNEWTRGKGGYKLLQYMACGIPAVASPVEINKEIITDGVDGFLASDDKEWVDKISQLVENVDLREKIGIAARIKVEKQYSLDKASGKLIKIFEEIINK